MQHNDSGRITVLLDDPDRDSCALGTLPQPGQNVEAFGLMRRKRHVSGHCVKDVEPRLAHTRNAEGPGEGIMACFRKIDCAQDFRDCCHGATFLTISRFVLVVVRWSRRRFCPASPPADERRGSDRFSSEVPASL
jgi:hypothetical protein